MFYRQKIPYPGKKTSDLCQYAALHRNGRNTFFSEKHVSGHLDTNIQLYTGDFHNRIWERNESNYIKYTLNDRKY